MHDKFFIVLIYEPDEPIDVDTAEERAYELLSMASRNIGTFSVGEVKPLKRLSATTDKKENKNVS